MFLILLVTLCAVERQISMLFIDNEDSVVAFVSVESRGEVQRMQKFRPPAAAENTELSEVPSLRPGIRQNIALSASPAASNICLSIL